jgi:hypothetical protein
MSKAFFDQTRRSSDGIHTTRTRGLRVFSIEKPDIPPTTPYDPADPDQNPEPIPLPPDLDPQPPSPIREPDVPPPITDPSAPEPTRLK